MIEWQEQNRISVDRWIEISNLDSNDREHMIEPPPLAKGWVKPGENAIGSSSIASLIDEIYLFSLGGTRAGLILRNDNILFWQIHLLKLRI